MFRTASSDSAQQQSLPALATFPPTDPNLHKSGFNRFFSSSKSSQKSGLASELPVPSIVEDDEHLAFRCCSAVAWDNKCAPHLSGNADSGIGLPSTVINALWRDFEREDEMRILARVPDSMDAEYEKQRFATEEFWKAQKKAADRQMGNSSGPSSNSDLPGTESSSHSGSIGKQKRRPSPLNLNLQPGQTPQKTQLSPLRQYSPLDISLPTGASIAERPPQGEFLPPLPASTTSSTLDATPRATSASCFTSDNGSGRLLSLHGRKRSQSVSRQTSSSPAPSSSPSPSPTAITFADRDRTRGRLDGQNSCTLQSSKLAPRSMNHLRSGSGVSQKDYQADFTSPDLSNRPLPQQELRGRRSLQNLSHERQRQSGTSRQNENIPPLPAMPSDGRQPSQIEKDFTGGASISRSSALSRPSISNLKRPSAPNLRAAAASSEMPLRPGMLIHGLQSIEMGRAMTDDPRGAGASPKGVFAPLHNVAMTRTMTDQTESRGIGSMSSAAYSSDRHSTRSSTSTSHHRRHQAQPSGSSQFSERNSQNQRTSSRAQSHSQSNSISSTSSSLKGRGGERVGTTPMEEARASSLSQSRFRNEDHQGAPSTLGSIQSGRSSIASLISDGSSNMDSPTIDSPQTPLSALARSPAELHFMLHRGGDRAAWDLSQTKKSEEQDGDLNASSALQLDLYGSSGDESSGERSVLLQYLSSDPAAHWSDNQTHTRQISPTIDFTPRAGKISKKDKSDGLYRERETPVKHSQKAGLQRESNNSDTSSSPSRPLHQSPEDHQPTTQAVAGGFRSRTFSFGRSSKPRSATVSSGSGDQAKDRSSIHSNSSSSKGSASAALGLLLSQAQQNGNGRSRESTSTISSSTSSNNSNSFNYSYETNPTDHSNPASAHGHSHSSPIRKKASFYSRRSNVSSVRDQSDSFQYEDQMNQMSSASGDTSPDVELSPTKFTLRTKMARKQRKDSVSSTHRSLTFID